MIKYKENNNSFQAHTAVFHFQWPSQASEENI